MNDTFHFSRLLGARAALVCALATVHCSAFAAGDPGHAGDPARGRQAYAERCAACHSIEHNGPGPAHRGLFGRKAGSLPDFPYSPALKSSAVTWSEETLDKWLTDPEKFIPGQKMWISIADADERHDIIAYLKAATRTGG